MNQNSYQPNNTRRGNGGRFSRGRGYSGQSGTRGRGYSGYSEQSSTRGRGIGYSEQSSTRGRGMGYSDQCGTRGRGMGYSEQSGTRGRGKGFSSPSNGRESGFGVQWNNWEYQSDGSNNWRRGKSGGRWNKPFDNSKQEYNRTQNLVNKTTFEVEEMWGEDNDIAVPKDEIPPQAEEMWLDDDYIKLPRDEIPPQTESSTHVSSINTTSWSSSLLDDKKNEQPFVSRTFDSWGEPSESDLQECEKEREKEKEMIKWKKGYLQRKKLRLEKQEKLWQAELKSRNHGDGLPDWSETFRLQKKYDAEMTARYPPLTKNTYIEDNAVANMTASEVSTLRFNLNNMTIADIEDKAVESLNPVTTFEQAFKPYQKFLQLINKHGFTKPSPIQCQLWPLIMSGRDVIGIAQTGTGKTLAYLIPGLIHIEKSAYYHSKKRDGPVALVLAPTRELAQQIHDEIGKFSIRNIKTVCVYGQGSRDEQLMGMDGCDIVVATPGRLLDFVKCGDVNLEGVSYFVLDEADRMLDMGFHPDIMKIYGRMRIDRQVVLTSATWKYILNFTAKNLMENPIKVNIGKLDLAAVETVTQKVILCEDKEKDKLFMDMMLCLGEDEKVIVFVNRKDAVDFLSIECSGHDELKWSVDIMHSGLDQNDRESSLRNLKSGKTRILIATDLASRGLDVIDLTKVINFDMPRNMEEYVHRSGRTGRAGRKGEVISFVTWDDRRNIGELIKIMERSDQEIPDELRAMSHRAEKNLANRRERGRGGRNRGGNFW